MKLNIFFKRIIFSKNYSLLLIILFSTVTIINAEIIERRREPFRNTPGHVIIPLPYSLPGIGQGLMVTGYAGNIMNSYTDVYAVGFNGDANGSYLAISELHLIKEMLYFSFEQEEVTKFAIKTSDGNYQVGDLYRTRAATATLSFFKRRLEFALSFNNSISRINKIVDYQDNEIARYNDPNIDEETYYGFYLILDFTDDREDPLKGYRLELKQSYAPPKSSNDPNYYTLSYSFSAYVPFFKKDTLVFNFYGSDVVVMEEGLVDYDQIKSEQGIDCEGDQVCEDILNNDINNIIDHNKNGGSTGLGGFNRLRSYGMNKFKNSHAQFFGAEYRLNVDQGKMPFNLGFIKDICHNLQIAFFWEEGTVAETVNELWDERAISYGSGFRLITESGVVYRFDYAKGTQGSEVIVMFNYPWSL